MADRSAPAVHVGDAAATAAAAAAAAELHARVREVDVDAWLAPLSALTPSTSLLALSEDEAEALVAAIRHRLRGAGEPSAAYAAHLARLETRLDMAIAAFGSAFVKTSSRSPKDSSLATDALVDAAVAALRSDDWCGALGLGTSALACGDANAQLAALLQASVECMRVRTGHAALELLACSERVFEDLTLELEAGRRVGVFRMSLVVREFVPMRADLEFRGFVHHSRLTAVSQYNHLCYYPALAAARAEHQAQIEAFFARSVAPLASSLPPSYTIDFALFAGDTGSARAGQMVIIELNPFRSYEGNGTDACLFDWTADRALIEAPEGCPLRVRTAADAELHSRLTSAARAVLAQIAARVSHHAAKQ